MAIAAFAAFAAFVIPASASASPRLCETASGSEPCTNLKVGAKVTGTHVGDWTFTGEEGSGNVVCSSVTMTGTVRESTETSFKIDLETASFSGTGTSGDCTGPLGSSVAVSTIRQRRAVVP